MARTRRLGMTAFGRASLVTALAISLSTLPTIGGDPSASALQAGQTVRISVNSAGQAATTFGFLLPPYVFQSSISLNGRYVAFNTTAELSIYDTDGQMDAYVRDIMSGWTRVLDGSAEPSQITSNRAMSPDGDKVVYTRGSRTLVYDRSADTRTEVLPTSDGGSISGDGRYIAFSSSSSSYVSGDTNAVEDVFRKDLLTGDTIRVSVDSQGNQANQGSSFSSISPDGTKVAFASQANNLVPNDTNACLSMSTCSDVFVRDIEAGTTTRVSVAGGGAQANGASDSAALANSAVAFRSGATNLVSGDTNGRYDVFVHDLGTGATQRASQNTNGFQGSADSGSPSISRDGRYVAFSSGANLAPEDLNSYTDVFVHDRLLRKTVLGSVNRTGLSPADAQSLAPAISADASSLSFQSDSETILPQSGQAFPDIFEYGLVSNDVWANPEGVVLGVPEPQTFGGCGFGLDAPNPTACQSDPVNSATGSFIASTTDLRLPGIGLDFDFARTYNSDDDTVGPLGRGWTHSYAASLTVAPETGEVVLRGETGQRVTFTRQPDGSYAGPVGSDSQLTATPTGYELLRRDQVRHLFDTQGRLTAVKDRNGNTITLTYAGSDLTTITDTAGRQTTMSYLDGRLTGVQLPSGPPVTFGYTAGLLSSVTDERGGVTSYTYSPEGLLMKVVNARNKTVVENTYQGGRVTQQLDGLGNRTLFAWDPATQTATMTDARGNQWRDVYSTNVLIEQVDPLGKSTRYSYDEELNAVAITDQNGNTTLLDYDSAGNLTSRKAPAPLNYTETWTHNSRNDITSYIDGRGNTTTYEYDSAGNLTSMTEPGGATMRYGRDPQGTGLLSSVTNPSNHTTSYSHDAVGNLTTITQPSGAKTTLTYDPLGRLTARVDPRGNVPGADAAAFIWNYAYDAAGNLLSQEDPLGNLTRWTYDEVGNVLTRVDALNRTTRSSYDSLNRLASVTAPDDTVTQYEYDASSNLTARIDAKGRRTTFEYDLANRVASMTSPMNQSWRYAYDGVGNRTKVTVPSGGTITSTFDALSRPAGIQFSDGTPSVSFGYDANSNLTSMTDALGTETRSFDGRNRLAAVTRAGSILSYERDAAGNVTKRTYPDGTAVTYGYDLDGRLTSVTTGGKSTTYAYDAAGNPIRTTLPGGNGYVAEATYDAVGRLTNVKNAKGGTTLSSFAYTFDPVGNPLSVTSAGSTTSYTYDIRDRLTKACFGSCSGSGDPFAEFTYDAVGNRLTQRRAAGTTTYAYNAADQLLSATGPSGTLAYSYGANGNQTTAGSTTFSYNVANQMTSATLGRTKTTYSYDGQGKRVQSAVGTKKTNYTWDPETTIPDLLLERDGNIVLRRYVHGLDVISMFTGGADFYYHHDGSRNVANVTSSTGATQWTYTYDPFGSLRTEVKANTKAPANYLRYGGQLLDSDTGLYHLRARQYDSGTGRFLEVDPIPHPFAEPYVAAYVYAENRPTVLADPSGLSPDFTDSSTWDHTECYDGVCWSKVTYCYDGSCQTWPPPPCGLPCSKHADLVIGLVKPTLELAMTINPDMWNAMDPMDWLFQGASVGVQIGSGV